MSEELLKQTNDIDYGSIYKTKLPVKMIKKDGSKEDFNVQKVINAVGKSAYRALTKFNDEEKGRTYYELNVGIPFHENAKVKSFDDIRSSDVFGGTNSFKQHPTHLNVAFDSDLKNSTL